MGRSIQKTLTFVRGHLRAADNIVPRKKEKITWV